jgi:hypothetical protein
VATHTSKSEQAGFPGDAVQSSPIAPFWLGRQANTGVQLESVHGLVVQLQLLSEQVVPVPH